MNREYLVSVERSDKNGVILRVDQFQFKTLEQTKVVTKLHENDPLIRTWIVKVATEE